MIKGIADNAESTFHYGDTLFVVDKPIKSGDQWHVIECNAIVKETGKTKAEATRKVKRAWDAFRSSTQGGIAMATNHRMKQIIVKGYNFQHDREVYPEGGLVIAAMRLSSAVGTISPPMGWSAKDWDKLIAKPREEKLAIAASWLMAEIDRLKFEE